MHDLSTVLGIPALSPQASPPPPSWPVAVGCGGGGGGGAGAASVETIAEQVGAVRAEAEVLAERMDALSERLQRSPAARSRAS